jgi:hypothetical protein
MAGPTISLCSFSTEGSKQKVRKVGYFFFLLNFLPPSHFKAGSGYITSSSLLSFFYKPTAFEIHFLPLFLSFAKMSDEVYEGAIGIDLGKPCIFQFTIPVSLTTIRHNLLLCCQLRRHKCGNQYVSEIWLFET